MVHDVANANNPSVHCSQCDLINFEGPSCGAGVVIESSEGILLVRRNIDPGMGLWATPAGFADGGESFEECAAREAREELSVVVENIRYLTSLPGVYASGVRTVTVYFRADLPSDASIVLDEENSEFGFFPLEALPEMAFPSLNGVFKALRTQN